MKTIETHARAFLTLNILAIGRVNKQEGGAKVPELINKEEGIH